MKADKKQVNPMPEQEAADLNWVAAERRTLPNLKFSTESISLRLPVSLLHAIKAEANRRDVPYQSFIKMVLAEKFPSHRRTAQTDSV
jgi:predicted DNA binding CopG/RHH family protein